MVAVAHSKYRDPIRRLRVQTALASPVSFLDFRDGKCSPLKDNCPLIREATGDKADASSCFYLDCYVSSLVKKPNSMNFVGVTELGFGC